jgi:hypothetical protein
MSPTFDMFTIGRGGRIAYDSRKHPADDKPSITVILLGPDDSDQRDA